MSEYKYSVKELIEINEKFEAAVSVKFHRLSKHYYLQLTDEVGNEETFTLQSRDFDLILKNFFIYDLCEIIDYMLDEKKVEVFINPLVVHFPVKIEIKELSISYFCNLEELAFINSSVIKNT